MRIDELDKLQAAHSDCLIAAFADISTGLTLRAAAGTQVPREALDELCSEAALTLGNEAPPLGVDRCSCAIKALDSVFFVYMRSPADPNDALIAMCRETIAMDAFLAHARTCFEDAS